MEGEALQRWQARCCSAWGDLVSSVVGVMCRWGRGKPGFLSRMGWGTVGLVGMGWCGRRGARVWVSDCYYQGSTCLVLIGWGWIAQGRLGIERGRRRGWEVGLF